MDAHRFTFDGLSTIERLLRKHGTGIAYVVLRDRTVRAKAETVGRFDLEPESAVYYLPEPDPTGFEGSLPLTHDDLVQAALNWMRETSSANTVGDRRRKYRVKIFGPTGDRMLESAQFYCCDAEASDEHEVDDEPPALPVVHQASPELLHLTAAEQEGVAVGMRALGEYYARWGEMVLNGVDRLQRVGDNSLDKVHGQLQDARGQVDTLLASVVRFRLKEIRAANDRHTQDRKTDAKTELANTALEKLGEAAQAFMVGQGLQPETMEVVATLGRSPALMAALHDPDVRALMEDPAHLDHLATMLRSAGQQARAVREAVARTPTPDPPSDPTPPTSTGA